MQLSAVGGKTPSPYPWRVETQNFKKEINAKVDLVAPWSENWSNLFSPAASDLYLGFLKSWLEIISLDQM